MWVLITLVLWAAISVPLALLAGRSLRSSRTPSIADEAEDYLRGRSSRTSPLALSATFALVAGLTVGVVVIGNEAVEQLPAAHLAASRGLDRLMGVTTTTTTTTAAAAAEEAGAEVAARSATGGERVGSTWAGRKAGPGDEGDDDRPRGDDASADEGQLAAAAPVGTGDEPAEDGWSWQGRAGDDDDSSGSGEGGDPGSGESGDDERMGAASAADDEVGSDDHESDAADEDDELAERRRRARARQREREREERERRSQTTTTVAPTTTTAPPASTTTTTEPTPEPGTTTTTEAPDGPRDDG